MSKYTSSHPLNNVSKSKSVSERTKVNNTKYVDKINSVIKNITPSIKFDNNVLVKNKLINDIYESVKKARNKHHECHVIDSSVIKPIHNKDQYPLSYILFRCLKETEMLDRIIKYSPNISDLGTFLEWYRENIESIDFNQIHQLINDIPKSYKNDNVYDTLITVHQLMFETTG